MSGNISTTRRVFDVSHEVEDGMITYRGIPAPVVCDFLSREESRGHYAGDTEFHIGKIELVANTGWDFHWRTDRYFEGHPFLTQDAGEYLVDAAAPVKVKGFETFPVRAFAVVED